MFPLIEQIINFPVPGKEQFYSHQHNTSYELFKSNSRFIYTILDIGDYICFVDSSDNILEIHEVNFLKERYSQYHFIVTNTDAPSSKTLLKAAEAKVHNIVGYYHKVLV
jgi:hypothetical protein